MHQAKVESSATRLRRAHSRCIEFCLPVMLYQSCVRALTRSWTSFALAVFDAGIPPAEEPVARNPWAGGRGTGLSP